MFRYLDIPRGCLCGAGVLLSLLLGCSATAKQSSSTGGAPPASTTTFYVNCSLSSDGNGTQNTPWNSLKDANSYTYVAGNALLFARGTTCNGQLAPLGSGSSGSPITIDAYGTGSLPAVNAGSTNTAALYLNNQEYWEVNNLELIGGVSYGVYVTGSNVNQPLHHIYLRNLNVHGATGTSMKRVDSGEVYLSPNGVGTTLNDILIDGVTAHDSKVSEGIYVNAGGGWVGGSSQPLGNNITIQNSTTHDIYGDGILITELTNGIIQNDVVYRSGLCPSCAGSTPGGLWEWWCHTCTVQNNESYDNQSWGGDGGDFDIDYYNTNNIVQYNYGHDSAGYCLANFGAESTADENNIIRYNVCSNNARNAAHVSQGDVFLSTWDNGSLNGIQIYNNTFYWNPAAPAALLATTGATFTGSNPNFFKNNIIYSATPAMVSVASPFSLDSNIYYVTSGSPTWNWNGTTYTSLTSYQAASSQDAHSRVADPLLNDPTSDTTGMPTIAFTLTTSSIAIGAGENVCAGIADCTMGTQDFFGNSLPTSGTGLNIGAFQ